MPDDLTPILVGAGQLTQRDVEPAQALEPLALMAEAARRAAADAGAKDALLEKLDSVSVVNIIGAQYGNPPRLLAQRLGARPAEEIYTTVGGNTPQWLVNETAERISAGHVGLALIAGAEAVYTLKRAGKSGMKLRWTSSGEGAPAIAGDDRRGSSEYEMAHHLRLPTQIYPLFENALRAQRGWSLAEHRRQLGHLYESFSRVAAGNPYAWFRDAKTADEITTVTPENRMIGFPYPKFMNAIMDVDQSAAVLMTSVSRARALGIDSSRWVYLRGSGDAYDHWFISERESYYTSPAIRTAARVALETAGLEPGEIDFIDLYSCFPCAVQIGRDMIGIAADDPRPLTVTGGLAYHGGPGSNYTLHAIATMMDRLRAAPDKKGLVTALGWYLTKHSIGIYGTVPREGGWSRVDPKQYQKEIDARPHPEVVTDPAGGATIETYTVLHDRDGRPETGVIVGRLEDGRRFLANTPADRALLEALMAEEAIGKSGTVSPADGRNLFVL